jgi:predicted ribosomally synthesized peptide with SipW-like signal peptide
MRRPRGIAGLGLLLALGLALGIGGGATYAAFFDTAQNAGNSFEAADDLRPPVIDDTVIEGGGNVEGAIRAGGTYRVYANATDLGSPPSGIASIDADLSNITTGGSAVALSTAGGPWTVGSTTYQWRSAQQTANGGLGSGNVNYSFTLTDNAGNSGNDGPYSVTVDNAGPTVTATVIQKSQGGVAGYIAQNGTYRVYANVSDPVGVTSVTADLSTISGGGASAVALTTTGGPWTVGGVSYDWRSGQQTASTPLSAGAKSYSITAADDLGNSGTASTGSVTVDNTVPTGSDWQTTNVGGGTAGQPEAGDTAIFSFSEPMEPESFLAGWDGSSTTVTARITQNANNDRFQVWDSANTTQLPFGEVALGGNFVNGSTRNFTGSSMVMSGSTITITLGTPSAATQTAGAVTPIWTPSASARDVAWNAMSTANVTQVGAPKVNF